MKTSLKTALFGAAIVLACFAGSGSAAAETRIKIEGQENIRYHIHNWAKGHQETSRRLVDAFGYWSINGEPVWCLEPSVSIPDYGGTHGPTGHFDNGSDAIQQGRTLNLRTFNGSTQVSLQDLRAMSAFQWLVYNASEDDLKRLAQIAEENHQKGGDQYRWERDTIRMARVMRTWGKYHKWTSFQTLIWQILNSSTMTIDGGQNIIEPIQWAVNDINGYELQGAASPWFHRNRYLNDTYLGSGGPEGGVVGRAGTSTGLNGVWTMRAVGGQMHNVMRTWIDQGILKYEAGFKFYDSPVGDQRQFGGGGRFTLKRNGYLKATKQFANLKKEFELNTRPTFDPNGIRIGVYNNQDGNGQPLKTLTIGKDGSSETVEMEEGTYYLYELDTDGNPIKADAKDVLSKKGYVSGKSTQSTYFAKVTVTSNQTAQAPAIATFENVPELVNFEFGKESAVAGLPEIDDQFKVEGAEYTLYKDPKATEPVLRDGKPVVATIDNTRRGRFTNLYRGVYYVKETKVPTFKVGNATRHHYRLDPKVYRVDLSNESTDVADETTTENDATNQTTKESYFGKKIAKFISPENVIPSDSKLKIKKIDSNTKESKPQGHASLAGAKFQVEFYEQTSLGKTNRKLFTAIYQTGADGSFTIHDRKAYVSSDKDAKMKQLFDTYEKNKVWPAYDYRVTEIEAPNGYKLPQENARTKDFSMRDKTNGDDGFTWDYKEDPFTEDDVELHLFKRQRVDNTTLFGLSAMQPNGNVAIHNAVFRITNLTTKQVYDNVKTDANGKLTLHGVSDGQYLLEEISSGGKYQTNSQKVRFTVAKDANTHKLTVKSVEAATDDKAPATVETDSKGDISVTYDNTPKRFTLDLLKVNENAQALEGASFRLTHIKDNGDREVLGTLKSDKAGKIQFDTALKQRFIIGDIYELEEVAAPRGYKLPAKRMRVQFRANAIPAQNKYSVYYRLLTVDKYYATNTLEETTAWKELTHQTGAQTGLAYQVDEAKGEMNVTLTMVNHTWQKLPATGSSWGLIVFGGISILLASGAGVSFYRRKLASK